MADYADILNQSWDDIPEPKLLPVGSWKLRNRGATYQPAKKEGNSDQVVFVYTPIEPMEDVNVEDLQALGADYDVQSNRIFARFFVSDGNDWDRVRKHIAKHGVEVKGKLADTLKSVKGRDVIAYLEQRSFTREGSSEVETANEAKNFAPVEA